MSQVNTKTLKLGQSANPAENFLVKVPTPEDGTLTIERENGTDVMTVNAAGKVAFPGNVVPAFSAYPSSTQSLPGSASTKVLFQTEEYDTSAAYDAATGVFTAPVAGLYQFNAVVAINAAANAAANVYNVSLFKNNAEMKRGAWVVGENTTNFGVSISYIANLSIDDTVDCRFVSGGANALATLNSTVVTYFQGCLVRTA